MDPSTTWGEETEDAFSVKQLYLSLPCEVDSKFAAERGLFTNGDPKAALAAANSNNNNNDDNTIESADAKAAARALNPSERRPVPIFNIEHILSHFDKKTMYIFDIDETLVMSPPHQFRGLTTIENHLLLAAIDIFERTNNVTFLQYVQMFVEERYRERLDSKMLIEGRTTLDVLQRLQNAGCWVFGLTSRYAHSVSRTDEMLTRIGIDFSHSTPLPADLSLQDPGTQAVYARGVIYTNAVDKGVVLNRFLENVLLRHVLDEEEKRKSRGEASSPNSNNGSAPSSPQGPRVFKEGEFFSLDSAASQDAKLQVPSSIVFIDDRISNVESILTGVPLADRLGIAIHGYHYLAASLERECDPNDKASAVPLPYDLDAHNSVEVMMEQLIYVRNQLTDPDTLKCVEALMKELRRPGFGRESSSVAASTSAPNLD